MDKLNRKSVINTNKDSNGEKILLMTLPFWSPLIPAQGIASLKSFLQQYGYRVKTIDATSESLFLELYDEYFTKLKEIIPQSHWGNLFNIGHDVLRNHMMAHTNYTDREEYFQLVKLLIYHTYYIQVEEAQVLELNKILSELFSRMEEFTLRVLTEEVPDVLGLSANSGNLASVRFVFELTRKAFPHIKTVMGGCIFFNHLAPGNPDLDFFIEKTTSYIDKIIIGKGEILFLKYLRGELPPSQRVFTLKDMDKETIKSYHFDVPDLSDYNLQKYFYLAATSSTSCPFKCSFCNSQTFFGEYRKRDPKQTVKDIIKLKKRYGHKLFFMTDALVNPTITELSHELINAGTNVYLDGYFRVDEPSGDIENTMLWRRGGFYRARLGTESGSQRVLDLMGKNISPEMIRTTLYSLAYAGIKTTTYWVVGHPGETEEDFQQTLDLITELKNEIWAAECNPFTYYYIGQANSDKWADKRVRLYPAAAKDMLITQTWFLDCLPSQEEIYHRVFRFAQHCSKLDIPNPYSADELYKADERWKKLHRNAVPSLIELMDHNVEIDEKKNIKNFIKLESHVLEEGDFAFR